MNNEYVKNNLILLMAFILCIYYGMLLQVAFGTSIGLLIGACIMTLSMAITEIVMWRKK